MKKINYTVALEDLQILYLHTRNAYKNLTFYGWLVETKKAYRNYTKGRKDVKSFSQWVNGQIVSIT